MATLTLTNLSKHFGRVIAVDQINIDVADTEFLCLLGPSGCGKSTALRMIAGFEEPTGGDILLDNTSIIDLPPNRRPTAMVFQKYTLWPHMRVFDNIGFGLKLRGMSRTDIQAKVEEGLRLVGLSGYEERFPSQLSGGQQQRIALARALVLEPKILLLDEPFSGLDALLRVRLREDLRLIQRRLNITTIFVTHDQEEALSLADRIAVMRDGHIEQVDAPSTIYAYPSTLFAADFIGAMNLFPAAVDDGKLRIGDQLLDTPPDLTDEKIMVGIRPEDFAIIPATTELPSVSVWSLTLEQLMDMGHYRKALLRINGANQPLKVYASKTVALMEGETVRIAPLRYLVYQGESEPREVQQSVSPELLMLH